MAITIANLQTILRQRVGQWIDAAAGSFANSLNGPGPGWNDPISYALRQCGLMPADIMRPADADLAALDPSSVDKVLDFAEYRLLTNVLQNYAAVDFSIGPRDEKASQLRDSLESAVERRADYLRRVYGYGDENGGGSLDGGVFGVDSQEQLA